MSTLPTSPLKSNSKTIAEIARASQTPKGPPQKQQTRGSRLNQIFEAEFEKFIGKDVEVETSAGVITGKCIGASVTMNLVIRTESHKIIIRHWNNIRRVAGL
jgi:hypothetical protein